MEDANCYLHFIILFTLIVSILTQRACSQIYGIYKKRRQATGRSLAVCWSSGLAVLRSFGCTVICPQPAFPYLENSELSPLQGRCREATEGPGEMLRSNRGVNDY
jgi:hypothetical protein